VPEARETKPHAAWGRGVGRSGDWRVPERMESLRAMSSSPAPKVASRGTVADLDQPGNSDLVAPARRKALMDSGLEALGVAEALARWRRRAEAEATYGVAQLVASKGATISGLRRPGESTKEEVGPVLWLPLERPTERELKAEAISSGVAFPAVLLTAVVQRKPSRWMAKSRRRRKSL